VTALAACARPRAVGIELQSLAVAIVEAAHVLAEPLGRIADALSVSRERSTRRTPQPAPVSELDQRRADESLRKLGLIPPKRGRNA